MEVVFYSFYGRMYGQKYAMDVQYNNGTMSDQRLRRPIPP